MAVGTERASQHKMELFCLIWPLSGLDNGGQHTFHHFQNTRLHIFRISLFIQRQSNSHGSFIGTTPTFTQTSHPKDASRTLKNQSYGLKLRTPKRKMKH